MSAKLDTTAVVRLAVVALTEAIAASDGPRGFILIVGKPGELDGEGAQYASNLEAEGAIDTLQGMVELLQLRAFQPPPGEKPH